MKKGLIVGGGMAGCTVTRELLKRNWQVTLIEKEGYLGGGCRTFFYGGHPYTEGPRPLYTSYPEAFDYLNNIIPMRKFKLFLLTYVEGDGDFYSFPIHKDDVARMPDKKKIAQEMRACLPVENARNFEEFWVNSVGRTLYAKFIDRYSKKMWKVEDNTIFDDFNWSVKGVALQEGPRNSVPSNIHAYPINPNGYNDYFDQCVLGAEVILNTSVRCFDLSKCSVEAGGRKFQADMLISTISPDTLMDYCWGELPYVGRDFMKLVLPVEKIFPGETNYIYYANSEPFTRVVEYKSMTLHKAPSTLLGIEIPSANGKLYPFTIKKEQQKAKKYIDGLPRNVHSIGRMGTYRYLNMGDIIIDVQKLIKEIEG